MIKKRARVPAGDSFVVRRIAGPGLASNYFYQVKGKRSNCSRTRLIEGNEKSLGLISNLQNDSVEAGYCLSLSPPTLLGFCLEVGKQFCRFWIRSHTKCESPEKYGLQHARLNPPPTPTHIVFMHLVTGGRVLLETMPLNTSWSKCHEKIMNALASSYFYGSSILLCDEI